METSDARKARLERDAEAVPPAADEGARVAEHVVRWTFDRGGVTSEAICNAAPDADCRLTSVSCECELWGEIQRRDDGTIWHKIHDYGESFEPAWHQVVPADYCNVALFINESGCVDELGGDAEFLIGEVPIRPLWVDGGCDWEAVTSPVTTPPSADEGLVGRLRALADATVDPETALLGDKDLLDALYESYSQHIGIVDQSDDGRTYPWCACGWRSDALGLDNTYPGHSYAIHLSNAQHAAVVAALQPKIIRKAELRALLDAAPTDGERAAVGAPDSPEHLAMRAEGERQAAIRDTVDLAAPVQPAERAEGCPSNTTCRGTCDQHTPLRPEHRAVPEGDEVEALALAIEAATDHGISGYVSENFIKGFAHGRTVAASIVRSSRRPAVAPEAVALTEAERLALYESYDATFPVADGWGGGTWLGSAAKAKTEKHIEAAVKRILAARLGGGSE